ncbi:MAG: dTMP kinase [Sphaerochaetaceae bacterium]
MQPIFERFIVLEGMDGAGTTTQMKAIAEAFDQGGLECHATFEPTTSPLGALVRSILSREYVTTPLALALLFAADREDHLHNPLNGILKNLDKGKVVISDRYLFSSLAYQSVELGFEVVNALNQFPLPRYVIYLDTPIEACLNRIAMRGNAREIFEKQEYLQQVRDNYELIFNDLPPEISLLRVPGERSKGEITAQILKFLKEHALL